MSALDEARVEAVARAISQFFYAEGRETTYGEDLWEEWVGEARAVLALPWLRDALALAEAYVADDDAQRGWDGCYETDKIAKVEAIIRYCGEELDQAVGAYRASRLGGGHE